jgi:hypothetical protein
MNIQQAQDEMYGLSEELADVKYQISILDDRAKILMDKKRLLLYRYPILDIRNIQEALKVKWSSADINRWGEGV